LAEGDAHVRRQICGAPSSSRASVGELERGPIGARKSAHIHEGPAMNVLVVRDRSHKMKHTVQVGEHAFTVDEPVANGGEDLGVTAHDLYDSALGTCKAMTVLWYARRKQIPVDDIRVSVGRDDSEERKGVYRLRVTMSLSGALTDAQRQELLAVANRCPVHKLMAQATTEIQTELAPVVG
jgi:putative redox protein